MNHRNASVALCSAVLSAVTLCAQRTRTLATTPMAGALPVTAHRQVAWASGGTAYLWDGTTVRSIPTGGNVVSSVGFVGRDRLFLQVEGGPIYGYVVYDVATATYTRLLSNPIDEFHSDGNAVAFPLPGYAGFGIYSGGASFTSFADGAATTYAPQISGRYVVYQRRPGTGSTDYRVRRYDRGTGATVEVSGVSSGGTDARVDEAGRVLWLAGGSTSFARAWWNDFVSMPRAIVDIGLGAMAYRYDAHLGQLAFARKQTPGTSPWDLILEDGGMSRVLDSTVIGFSDVRARDGMAAWVGMELRLFDGATVMTPVSSQSSTPRGGTMLDRGWAVYNSGNGAVVLRESALTWDQNTLSTALGGSVQLNLIAGPANAGRLYLVLASLSGAFPGIAYGGYTIPLNYDSFLEASAALANSGMFVDTAGYLDGAGNATARFVLPPGLATGLAGRSLTFAYLLLTPSFSFVSNPARVKLVP